MALDPTRQALAEALDVCASVSKANLARRDDTMPSTLVNPYALRRLADALEALVPGAIDSVRAENDRRRADAAALREEQARRALDARQAERDALCTCTPRLPASAHTGVDARVRACPAWQALSA